jgi:hypothetical protein
MLFVISWQNLTALFIAIKENELKSSLNMVSSVFHHICTKQCGGVALWSVAAPPGSRPPPRFAVSDWSEAQRYASLVCGMDHNLTIHIVSCYISGEIKWIKERDFRLNTDRKCWYIFVCVDTACSVVINEDIHIQYYEDGVTTFQV